jgi:hypothetical protein
MIPYRRKVSILGAAFKSLIAVAISGAIGSPANAEAPPMRPDASAFVTHGDGHGHAGRIRIRSGNGRFNRNYSTVLSPTINRGLQQVSNTNVSGRTSTLVGFCTKRQRICKIHQRIGG